MATPDFIRDAATLWVDKIDTDTNIVKNPVLTWSAADIKLAKSALISIQTYLLAGTLDVVTPTTFGGLHVKQAASPSVGPETDHIGFRGQWFQGVDVANAPTSRDYVMTGVRGTYAISDGATTLGVATLTSASDGGFTTALIGASVTGAGIPDGTTVSAVSGTTSLTMSASATATASSVAVTFATGASSDLAYWKHRGALSPTLGIGVTPPDGSARLQVSSSDAEPAMGTIRLRRGPSQTGKVLTIHDSTPIDQWWIDSGFYMSGSSGNGVKVQAEPSATGIGLIIADNTKAQQYAFTMPTGSGGVLRIKNATNNANIMDLGTDGSLRHLSTKLAFFGASTVTKPSVTGSRGGNAALASLLAALASLGLITDSTTA